MRHKKSGSTSVAETAPTCNMPSERSPVKVIGTVEVAAMLGMNRQSVAEAARRGEIPSVRVGRLYRYSAQAIEDLMAHRRPAATDSISVLIEARIAGLRAELAALEATIPATDRRLTGRE
jgi:excisionase family DNA binding protein